MRLVGYLIGLCLALAACGRPDPLAGLQPGERGRVVRVIDGDALVLDTSEMTVEEAVDAARAVIAARIEGRS